MKKFFSFFGIITLVLIIFGLNVFALDAPNPPRKFTATSFQGNNEKPYVIFYWARDNNGIVPILFDLYQADEKTNDMSKFKRVEYIRSDQNALEYKWVLNNLPNGVYSFYLTAAAIVGNNLIESSPSDIVTVEINYTHKPYIRILSKPDLYTEIGKEYTYQVKAETNLPTDCPLVYALQDAPKGMIIDEKTGFLRWKPETNGFFNVTIHVFTYCKLNYEPAIQQFTINVGQNNNEPMLKIVSKPPLDGAPGVVWYYQPQVQSNMRCPIQFEMMNEFYPGMSFDKNTGMIKWIPEQEGIFVISLRAFMECNGVIYNDYQKFEVVIGKNRNQPFCATFFGNVSFDDANILVNEGTITAWRLDEKSNVRPQYTIAFKGNSYIIQVPEGQYILQIDGPNFKTEWFKDADSFDKGKIIQIKCNERFQADFVVSSKPTPKHYTVSGNVSSELDNSPIYAMVEFIPVEWIKNNNMDKPDFTAFQTQTDKNGNYHIKLPDIYIYRAHAISMMNRYDLDQWYNGADSPFEADLIELTSDLNDINFVLKSHQKQINGFSGTVKDESGKGLKSMVLAYLVKPLDNSNANKRFSLTTYSDENGNFQFKNLIPGNYVLLSIPNDRKFAPGYYRMGDFAVLKWKDATQIAVGENMIEMIFEIKHRERKGFKGIIHINGTVRDVNGMIKKSDSPQGNAKPIAGAFVYVLDESGDLSDFAFTDVNGKFEMSEIAEGANKLLVDAVGYELYQQNVNSDFKMSPNSNITIGLTPEEVMDVIDNNYQNDIIVYPNPASDFARIQFSSIDGNSKLDIYNQTGNLLYSDNITTIQGVSSYNLNLGNFANGTYIIRVNNRNKVYYKIINIVR